MTGHRSHSSGVDSLVGFQVLVEKILRSLPGVKNVYLLMRQKKGTSGDDRLKDLWNSRVSVMFYF